jgi:spore germination protein KA
MTNQWNGVWSVDTTKFPARAVEKPHTELSVRGSDEAFNEVVATQLAQLRHRIRDPGLRVQRLTVGTRQHAPVLVTHLAGIANPDVVHQVMTRLQALCLDGQISSSQIAGLIRDHPWSIFPTIRTTERVDLAVDALLKGKVVVLVDGDPFALVVPAVLADFYMTAMDYTAPWYDTSFVRLIRIIGWAMGVYLPGLYIALTEVNVNLLPPPLLILTAGNHAGLPFPPVVEALLMVFVIEVLREAALRLPQMLSVTIGTVGAIVVGTAVVKAGLVSPQMIIVITLTALSFYSVPVYELTGTWRLVNFFMLMAGAIVGVYGLIWVSMWLVATLIGLTSFGVPYFAPMAPFHARDWRDLFIRAAWPALRWRPSVARPRDIQRWARPSGT